MVAGEAVLFEDFASAVELATTADGDIDIALTGGNEVVAVRGAGGEGTGGSPAQGGAGAGRDQGTSPDQQEMSREQAEQILNAMEQDERDLTREMLRRGQQRTPVARDW